MYLSIIFEPKISTKQQIGKVNKFYVASMESKPTLFLTILQEFSNFFFTSAINVETLFSLYFYFLSTSSPLIGSILLNPAINSMQNINA
ncbi:hypothetical protein QL285_091022 [Trifolium repens]|nr:hypothetical protein QL285_091022 [Trifolium repens]